jgi:nucleoside-diphosphate-sugar epimerase
MKYLVTGAAGFVGSHLCERLLRDGHRVLGLDAFIPYYPRIAKERNLKSARTHSSFEFVSLDLRTDTLDAAVNDVDAVFHLAAMPGLPRSWTEFDLYQGCNFMATQRLLDAVHRCGNIERFIYVSTSSVYGRHASGDESMALRPISPYGVTKLAAENLCRAYAEEFDLPLIVLRYFSVYGPRQRPDMGYHRFIESLLCGWPITVFGDGQQVRGNTYVDDCVAATTLALESEPNETFNVGGSEPIALMDVIRKLEALVGCRAVIERKPPRPGDQQHTLADTSKLKSQLGWWPKIGIDEGLARQVAWQKGYVMPVAA